MERTERMLQIAQIPEMIDHTFKSLCDDLFSEIKRGSLEVANRKIASFYNEMIFYIWVDFFTKFNPVMPGKEPADKLNVGAYFRSNARENEKCSIYRRRLYIHMPNLVYTVSPTLGNHHVARPDIADATISGRHLSGINMPADKLADLIRAFDSIVPQIKAKADSAASKLDELRVEENKKRIIAMMQKQMIDSLSAEFLVPEGLDLANYKFSEDGNTVHVRIEQLKAVEMEIPVTRLAETLKDTEKLKEGMKVCKTQKKPEGILKDFLGNLHGVF